MRFNVLTLFPDMVRNGLNTSIIGRASENNLIEINAVNIRDYTNDKHGKVDDYTYGGGAGMLMQAQPVYDAWESVSGGKHIRTIYVTPQGKPFDQKYAVDLAGEEELIILCGHYEGIDDRALEEIVTDYVSIGDYVLTGGEIAAMVIIDAVSRLVPAVLHNDESAEVETFHRDLLEYPQYSRPETWHGITVPEVLLSGNHRKIAEWRLEQSKLLTKERRPDLYERYLEREKLIKKLTSDKRHNIHMMESLARGKSEIIVNDGENILLYDISDKVGMMSADTLDGARRLADAVPENVEMIVVSQEFICEVLERQGFEIMFECRQACYTLRNTLPVRHKDIRMLTMEHYQYVKEQYNQESEEYLEKRILSKALFGAFIEGRLAGFAGWHSDGSIGILYVEEAYRRQGLGASLEAFCINRHLEMGYVPFAHICADNDVSIKMQESMGLYLSKENLWWLRRS